MARPKNANAEETRERILEAAMAELAESGPLSFSTRSVAGRAGVGVATVHHYFADRQGLVDACINSMYAELTALTEKWRDALRTTTTLHDGVGLVVREGFRFARANQVTIRALQVQVFSTGALDAARRGSTQLPLLASLASVISRQTNVSEIAARVRVQSVIFAAFRWATATDEELCRLTGLRHPEHAVTAVESELIDLATALLRGEGARRKSG